MNKRVLILTILAIVIGFAGMRLYLNAKDKPIDKEDLTTVTVAMDWVPNTNHTGLYVAEDEGFYEDEGIDLEMLPYSFTVTPDTLVGTGKADVGISFTESVVASSTTDAPVTSIAAIIPTNTSSIAVRKDSGIDSPKDLDGKLYGGYGAVYEDAVMGQVIKNDGGSGEFETVVVDTDLLDALKSERVDFVWIFDAWQKIQAERSGFEIKTFPIVENGVPDYYTPVFIAKPETITDNADVMRRFVRATQKGYEFATNNPQDAAKILIDSAEKGTFDDEGLVYESQNYLADIYKDSSDPWGFQKESFWQNYPDFMLKNNAVTDIEGNVLTEINRQVLFTNKFIENEKTTASKTY